MSSIVEVGQAGLYDANSASSAGGTSPTATSGILEIGKKRYLHEIYCNYKPTGSSSNNLNRNDIQGVDGNTDFATSANLICPNQAGFTVFSAMRNFPLATNRYIHEYSCNYNNGVDGLRQDDIQAIDNNPTFTHPTFGNNCPPATGYTVTGGILSYNLLGQRYIHEYNCSYDNGSTDSYRLDAIASIDNNPISSNSCAVVSGYTATGTVKRFDLLSSSRSTGYIYYEMISASDTTAGTYGTTTTALNIADVGFVSTVPTGSATDITIANDPAFSIKKVLANIGTGTTCPTTESSYTSSISGVNPGDKICVRLKYQNKTNGAISNAKITDKDLNPSTPTVSDKLAYIPNSTKNCLTPEIGPELCTTAAGMGGAIADPDIWTSGPNNLKPIGGGAVLDITPHAGFYGIPTTQYQGDIMEMGKKRYLHMSECDYTYSNGGNGLTYNRLGNNIPSNLATSNPLCPASTDSSNSLNGSGNSIDINILGYGYVHISECDYSGAGGLTYNRLGSNIASNSATNNPNCATTTGSGNPLVGTGANIPFNILGNRFIHLSECDYSNGGNGLTYNRLGSNIASNSATNNPNCATTTGSGNPLVGSYSTPSNLLYTPNGRGYIQYQLQTSSTNSVSSLTLPNVSLSGDGQTTSTSNAVINFASTPLTPTDIPSLTVTCGASGVGAGVGSAVVNSTTTCSFPIPPNKTLPTDFKISIGTGTINQLNCNNTTTPNTPGCNSTNSAVAQACTLASGTVTCNNIPTGNSIGAMPIYGNLGSGTTATKTATGETVNITGINFGGIVWNFTPNQGGTAPLFRSTDNTTVNINNFKTIIDPTPTSNTRYTCNLEYRKINDRLATSTPTWTSISTTPVPYTTGNTTNSGCSFTLTKAMRANNLNYSLRLTITDTTITTPTTTNPNTYTFYNEYIYRFQGAGVASGG